MRSYLFVRREVSEYRLVVRAASQEAAEAAASVGLIQRVQGKENVEVCFTGNHAETEFVGYPGKENRCGVCEACQRVEALRSHPMIEGIEDPRVIATMQSIEDNNPCEYVDA